MIMTPSFLSISIFRWVAGLSYMPVFIAGETSLGHRAAKTVVESMSSAMPQAIFAMMLAVAGATKKTSAFLAKETCWTFHWKLRSKVSTETRLLVSVSNTSGAMNSVAFLVIMTWTSTPFLIKSLQTCAIL
jgi:hypothetical protein